MSVTCLNRYRILALSLVLVIPACGGSDPQTPANTSSSISGTVVFDQTSSPAAGVDVVLERQTGSSMMMDQRWDQTAHMMTNSHGQFHFEYMHDSMHRYRLGVRDMNDWHTCDFANQHEDGVVLRIPAQSP